MPTIKPLRVLNEYDVINWFKFNPTGTYPAVKGSLVKVISGVMTDQNLQQLGDVGAHYTNIVSQRYGVQPFVGLCTASGDVPVGLLLYDVRETDENGEKLAFHPDKQAKMQAVLSGQAVPIAAKGIFLYSGTSGTPIAGGNAYANGNGTIQYSSATPQNCTATKVGTFLGPADANGFVYLKLDL